MDWTHPVAQELHAQHRGVLLADGRPSPTRIIIDPPTGRVVLPVPPDALDADEHVLALPDEGDDSIWLLLHAGAVRAEDDFACDRWRAYHGSPDFGRWLAGRVDSAKWHGQVYPADTLGLVNPLTPDLPALCTSLNADRDALARICVQRLAVRPTEPVAVGIDPMGLDVRARFGVLRLAFDTPAPSADLARAELERWSLEADRSPEDA